MKFGKWRSMVERIYVLDSIADMLDIDMQTIMPPGGTNGRATAYSTVKTMHHECLTDPRLLEVTRELLGDPSLTPDEQTCVKAMHKNLIRAHRRPADLVAALAEAEAKAHAPWEQAKTGSGDFGLFAPFLKEIVNLKRQMGAACTTTGNPYDGLIDDFEPGLTEDVALGLLEAHAASMKPLLDKAGKGPHPDISITGLTYNHDAVRAISHEIILKMGVDPNRTHHGTIAHAMCAGFNPGDVRVFTWREYRGLKSEIYATIHENGHALYNLGFRPEWAYTPLAQAISTGIHESQSSFWEVMICQSKEFWLHVFPLFAKRFPHLLAGKTPEEMFRAMNRVFPDFIRVDADPYTYDLHILLRTRIESMLIKGAIDVDDVPDAWNEMSKDLLGIRPPNNAKGCLQDVHWSCGYFGYFPCYSVGHLAAAQFAERMQEEFPIWEVVKNGDWIQITNWLGKNIHERGQSCTGQELVADVTGSELSHEPFNRIMSQRLTEAYAFETVSV